MSKTLAVSMVKALIEDLGPDCFVDALIESIEDNEGRVFEFSGYRKPSEYELEQIVKLLKKFSSIAKDIENY